MLLEAPPNEKLVDGVEEKEDVDVPNEKADDVAAGVEAAPKEIPPTPLPLPVPAPAPNEKAGVLPLAGADAPKVNAGAAAAAAPTAEEDAFLLGLGSSQQGQEAKLMSS